MTCTLSYIMSARFITRRSYLVPVKMQELKLGYLAQRHAGIAAKNIKLLMKNANDNNLNVYKPALPLSLIALGKREAVAQFYCISCIGRLPGMIKSGDLYVGKTRKQLGLLSEL